MYAKPQNQPFYLIPRKGKRKKRVYYYRVMDENRKPIGEWSTGFSRRYDAECYCRQLLKENKLIPTVQNKSAKSGNPSLFRDYFSNWFLWEKDKEPECPYISKKLRAGKSFNRQTASTYRSSVTNYLIPAFGDRPKDRITAGEIEEWLFALPEKKKISARTANNCYSVLRTMMIEACRLGHIPGDPTKAVETLGDDGRKKDILRWKEVDKLFNTTTAGEVWQDPLAYVGTLLAAASGIRTGELRGLLVENLHKNHIEVKHSASALDNSLGTTKSKKIRLVPIPEQLYKLLYEISPKEGYVFSLDGGKSPLNHKYFRDHFKKALTNIGIKDKAQKDRNLVFHGWRVFYNTVLQVNQISDAKIRAIIGHEKEDMTRLYTNIPLEAYQEEKQLTIPQIQLRIIGGKHE